MPEFEETKLHRTQVETIDRFLDRYIDRDDNEDCGNEQLTSKNLVKARELLSSLGEDFGGHRGLIVVDEPPPENEEVFQRIRVESYRLCLYSCVWHK
ncbi:hypothetical protein [Chamaesiphon sp.]|uniref:hypothetical protein n=1 Tax=Chamaesiphon sp. TaxID=2814140 RepID=UPI0035942A5B